MSKEAEMAVVGCLLLDESRDVFGKLPSKCFGDKEARTAYIEARKLYKAGKKLDLVTLSQTVSSEFLGQCCETVVSTSALPDYIGAVIESYRKREIYKSCSDIADRALGVDTAADLTSDLFKALEYQQTIARSQDDGTVKEFEATVIDYFRELYKPKEKTYKTRFGLLDLKLGGIRPETLTILAGRSGMGKTDFAINIAVNLAKQCRVLYISLEMPKQQILDRISCNIADVDSVAMRDGMITDEDRRRIQHEYDLLVGQGTNLIIDDSQALTEEDLDRKITRWNPAIVFIDHVGLMRGDPKKQRWEVFTQISQNLKNEALKRRIAFVALVQQNAEVEKRKDKTAKMSDVKGTDSFSNDADAMLFVSAVGEETPGELWRDATIQIVKNRQGSLGEVKLHWYANFHRYREVER